MKLIINPPANQWERIAQRPVMAKDNLEKEVAAIMESVKLDGDAALRKFALQFDGVALENFKVSNREFSFAAAQVSSALKQAIGIAANNIKTFHAAQLQDESKIETMPGVTCWRRSVAIENVGLYIPGGTAPLFSTILMLAIPARIAGCKRIALCTPCDKNGKVNDVLLYTAASMGITEVYKIGGAQAIAAMAYGTASIASVHKIFGPGNQYVTMAKEWVQKNGTAIDLPAGPSEILLIADDTADAEFVAADLLSQAEHGTDSQVVLLSNSEALITQVFSAINNQLKALPRAGIAEKCLQNSFAIQFSSIDDCLQFSNLYAPEHLIIAVENAAQYISQIVNAGSVFLGNYSCESAGDYASGTNHTLPTNGYARSYSAVSVDSFVKKITYQHISPGGLQNIGPTIEKMAEAEQLIAHKNAVSIRLKKLNNA